MTYTIPPTKLIHLDIDPAEIGKNYPAEIALVADAKAGLIDLLDAARQAGKAKDYKSGGYFAEIQSKKAEWDGTLAPLRDSDSTPVTMPRAMKELRAALDREAIATSGAGHGAAGVSGVRTARAHYERRLQRHGLYPSGG